MSDLTEFLLARIAEDEAVARATSGQPWSATVPGMVHADGGFRIKSRYVAIVEHDEDRAHIARHNPARVLAECKAKRRIVALCQVPDPHTAEEAGGGCTECAVLYTLALPYAAHPDYDEAWRP